VLCHVALAAGHGNVQAEKRVGRQVVVKGDLTPTSNGMTFLAGLLHGGAVRVVGAVAASAVCAKFLNFHDRRVTGVTVDLRVRSRQWEFCVVVAGYPPKVVAVTISARDAKAALMTIVSLVATDAALRNGGMQVPAAVAVGAPDMGMTPKEGEASLTGVIELLRVPVRSGVAVAALLPLITFVSVVRCVATDTARGHAPVLLAGVTCRAGCLHMFAGQCKGRLIVVEVRDLPGFCLVTGGAIRAERATMGVILRMTPTTLGRGLAISLGFGSFVTALARRGDVGVAECEVGEVVSESNLTESRDIGIAAQVLCVASAALTAGGLPHTAVITAFGADIRSDLFVTIQALRALPLTIGEVVTGRAFGLDPRVRLRDRTGHDELLNAGRPGARAEQQPDAREN
jgi:hypothetical protein